MFAEWDQQGVDLGPVLCGQALFEGGAGCFGGRRRDVAPAVGDAVDVDVYADAGLVPGYAESQVGGDADD